MGTVGTKLCCCNKRLSNKRPADKYECSESNNIKNNIDADPKPKSNYA